MSACICTRVLTACAQQRWLQRNIIPERSALWFLINGHSMSGTTAPSKTAAGGAAGQGIKSVLLRFWPDFYGERSFFGPRYRSKTSLGGCISVIFVLLISLLFAYTWVEFFGSGYFLSIFGTLHSNSLVAIGDNQNITALRDAILPTLSLFISAYSRSTRVQDVVATTIVQSPTMRASVRHLRPTFA